VQAVERSTARSPERDFNITKIFDIAAAASHEGTVMPVPGFVIVKSKLRTSLGLGVVDDEKDGLKVRDDDTFGEEAREGICDGSTGV